MAKLDAVRCDSCGAVVPKEESTEVLHRYKGPRLNGEYVEDLCSGCAVVPEDVELKPWPRQKKADDEPVSG